MSISTNFDPFVALATYRPQRSNKEPLKPVKPLKPIIKILTHLNPSDLQNCCLTSNRWNQILSENQPLLLLAIKTRQTKHVKYLLDLGASAKFCVPDSHLTKVVSCTPYIYAMERGDFEIADLLQDHEERLTSKYAKNKLLSNNFQVKNNFYLESRKAIFACEGLGHFIHHTHLIPHIIASLKDFFAQYVNKGHWTEGKTHKLISLVEQHSCSSCTQQFNKLLAQESIKQGIFISDTSIFNHTHWISIVSFYPWIAIGNRGLGSKKNSGVMVYEMKPEFTDKSISALAKDHTSPKDTIFTLSLPLPEQISGSCSIKSFEAGILAAICLLMVKDDKNKTDLTILAKESQEIFCAWNKHYQISFLSQIMNDKDDKDYDPELLKQILASFDACQQTSASFYQFLLSRGIIPWESIEGAFKKNDSFLLDLAVDTLQGENMQTLLIKALRANNYVVAEALIQKGVEVNGVAGKPYLSPLQTMVSSGNEQGLRWVLDHGVNPNGIHPTTKNEDVKWHLLDYQLPTNIANILIEYGGTKRHSS